jgi:hypothetical protein
LDRYATIWNNRNNIRILSNGSGSFFTKYGRRLHVPSKYSLPFSNGIPLELAIFLDDSNGIEELNRSLSFSRGDNREGEIMKWWDQAKIVVLDAPYCHGDLKDRLEFARHQLREDITISSPHKVNILAEYSLEISSRRWMWTIYFIGERIIIPMEAKIFRSISRNPLDIWKERPHPS